MATATHISTDQNWADETTVYWFQISGTDYGTGYEFDGDTYGVAESGPLSTIVDCDGCPLTEGDAIEVAVRNSVTVTDQLRAEG